VNTNKREESYSIKIDLLVFKNTSIQILNTFFSSINMPITVGFQTQS